MTIDHLMRAVRHAAAANGSGALSSGEAITAALVLNRADWLADMGYTIGQALDRIDEGDVELIPRAEKLWRAECESHAEVAAIAARAAKVADLFGNAPGHESDDPLHLDSQLVTYGDAPGYRHVLYLVFDVSVVGRAVPEKKHRIELRVRAADGDPIVSHIMGVHRFAWSDGNRPIDAAEGERRPTWIDRIR
jgi:hypothetical protein